MQYQAMDLHTYILKNIECIGNTAELEGGCLKGKNIHVPLHDSRLTQNHAGTKGGPLYTQDNNSRLKVRKFFNTIPLIVHNM